MEKFIGYYEYTLLNTIDGALRHLMWHLSSQPSASSNDAVEKLVQSFQTLFDEAEQMVFQTMYSVGDTWDFRSNLEIAILGTYNAIAKMKLEEGVELQRIPEIETFGDAIRYSRAQLQQLTHDELLLIGQNLCKRVKPGTSLRVGGYITPFNPHEIRNAVWYLEKILLPDTLSESGKWGRFQYLTGLCYHMLDYIIEEIENSERVGRRVKFDFRQKIIRNGGPADVIVIRNKDNNTPFSHIAIDSHPAIAITSKLGIALLGKTSGKTKANARRNGYLSSTVIDLKSHEHANLIELELGYDVDIDPSTGMFDQSTAPFDYVY